MSEEKNINNNNEENTLEEFVEITTEGIPEEDLDNSIVEKKSGNKKIKTIIATTLVGVLGLGVGFISGKEAGRKLPATNKNYSNNKVIATVGDTNITEKELKYRMEPLFYANAKNELSEEEIKAYESSMIDYMTTTEVLYLEGKKEKISATKEEVATEYETLMASISQQLGITEEILLNEIKIPKEQIEKDLEKELIATKYLGEATDVSEKEAKSYYDKNKDEFLTVKASHILIQTRDEEGNELSDAEKKKKKEEAENILSKVKEGQDFATLAKQHSDDGSAASGGDLGYFGRGQMVEEFETAAYSLKVGDVSDKLVESDFGYHIIKKTDEKHQEFDEIKEDVQYNLSYQKQSNLLDDLVEKYNVTVK